MVASAKPSAEQLVGDGDALTLVAEVSDDAEEVARVDARGQGAEASLGVEDGDGVDNDVEGVAGDGDTEVCFGIEQVEAKEGFVEKSTDARVLPSARSGSREQLLLASLLEGSAGGVDLLRGDGQAVELDAGASCAVLAGAVVEGAGPGLDDEDEDLGGELARGVCVQFERGRGLLK